MHFLLRFTAFAKKEYNLVSGFLQWRKTGKRWKYGDIKTEQEYGGYLETHLQPLVFYWSIRTVWNCDFHNILWNVCIGIPNKQILNPHLLLPVQFKQYMNNNIKLLIWEMVLITRSSLRFIGNKQQIMIGQCCNQSILSKNTS